MEKELQDLIDEMDGITEDLEKKRSQVKAVKTALIKERGKGIFESVREFAELFKKGAVHKKFESIRQQFIDLQEVDPNYLTTIASGDPYGMTGDAELNFLVSYLFGGAWQAHSELWPVLEKIADLADMDGNFFTQDLPEVADERD